MTLTLKKKYYVGYSIGDTFLLCKTEIAMFLLKFYKTVSRFDVDNVNFVEKTKTKKINITVAMGNTKGYDITYIKDIPSVEMINITTPEEITTYGQTTIINASENGCDIFQHIALFNTV